MFVPSLILYLLGARKASWSPVGVVFQYLPLLPLLVLCRFNEASKAYAITGQFANSILVVALHKNLTQCPNHHGSGLVRVVKQNGNALAIFALLLGANSVDALAAFALFLILRHVEHFDALSNVTISIVSSTLTQISLLAWNSILTRTRGLLLSSP